MNLRRPSDSRIHFETLLRVATDTSDTNLESLSGRLRRRSASDVDAGPRAGAARFPLWAATAAEFGALSGQKAACDPQWVWDAPWYGSFGVWRSSVLRRGLFSYLEDPPARPVKQVPLSGCLCSPPWLPTQHKRQTTRTAKVDRVCSVAWSVFLRFFGWS